MQHTVPVRRRYCRAITVALGAVIFLLPSLPLAAQTYTRVYGWGASGAGQLGNNSNAAVYLVPAMAELYGKTPIELAVGPGHTLALDADGTIYAWGSNWAGQLGNNSTTDSLVPVIVNTADGVSALYGKTVIAIAAGDSTSYALTADGLVFAWGTNDTEGRLGNNSTTASPVPIAVDTSGVLAGKTITKIAAGSRHVLVLDSDGKVYAWGWNSHYGGSAAGQLGHNSWALHSRVPVAVYTGGVLAGKVVTDIAVGGIHSVACASDGTAYGWGIGSTNGQLGQGSKTNSLVPVAVNMGGVLSGKTVTSVAAGYVHSLALTSDGIAYGWGSGAGGRLGANTGGDEVNPIAIATSGELFGKTVTAIASGVFQSYALTSEGVVYSWGMNVGPGALGDNTTSDRGAPAAVNTDAGVSALAGATVQHLASGSAGYGALVIATSATLGAPDAPINVVGTAGDGEVSVSFAAPPNGGGDPITGYTVTVSPGGTTFSGASSPIVVTGLLNGIAYTFTVTATNGLGTSVASAASDPVTGPVPYVFTTFAGSGDAGATNDTGTAAEFSTPHGVAIDSVGDLYIADAGNHLIRKISTAGVVTTLAGSGSPGSANDTGTAASFNTPTGVTVDTTGNVYVADSGNHLIRKITSAGVVTTLAGSGSPDAVDGNGMFASFDTPTGVAVDSAGNVFVADSENHLIRRIDAGGEVTTYVGSGYNGWYDTNNGEDAEFDTPTGVAVDVDGNVYVADASNNAIRKISTGQAVSTLAGVPWQSGSADGTGEAAQFNRPTGVVVDGAGNVYVADRDNHKIRKVTSTGVTTTLAGDGSSGANDGAGAAAEFNSPNGIAVSAAGLLYVADSSNHKIRAGALVDYAPVILEVSAPDDGTFTTGEHLDFTVLFSEAVTVTGLPTLEVTIGGVARSAIYLSGSDTDTLVFRYTIPAGETDNDGIAAASPLVLNGGTIQDEAGQDAGLTFTVPDTTAVWVEDPAPEVVSIVRHDPNAQITGADEVVFEVTFSEAVTGVSVGRFEVTSVNGGTTDAVVSAVTGGPTVYEVTVELTSGAGDFRLDVVAPSAVAVTLASGMNTPVGLTIDSAGNVYVSNNGNGTISKVTSAGTVTSFTSGIAGPEGLAIDGAGNLYVVHHPDSVAKIDTNGVTSAFAAGFTRPRRLAFDGAGNLYVSNFNANSVSMVTPGGVVSTFATGFNRPSGLGFDGDGNLYVANFNANSVSMVTPGGVVSTFATGFNMPDGLAFDDAGNFYVANFGGNSVSKVTPEGTVSTLATGFNMPAGLEFDAAGDLYVVNFDTGTVSRLALGTIDDLAGQTVSGLPYTSGEVYTYDPNDAPTDIALSNDTVNQSGGANTTVGTLSTTDADLDDSHTYTLVSGAGDTNNALFNLSGAALRANDAAALAAGSYSVRIQTDDANGGTFAEAFAITVVDDVAPSIDSVSAPADGSYPAGQHLDFTVNFSEAVTVTGTPALDLTIGAIAREAAFLSGSESSALVFRYTIQAGEGDSDGIASASPLALNGGTIQDAASLDAIPTFSPPTTTAVLVDTAAPTVESIERFTPLTEYVTSGFGVWRVTFSEPVSGVDLNDFNFTQLAGNGTVWGHQVTGGSVVYYVSGQYIGGISPYRLDLNASSTGITDASGNPIAAGFTDGEIYQFDDAGPAVDWVVVPAAGTYGVGDELDVTIHYYENAVVTGSPSIELTIGGTARQAVYASGSGTVDILFRYTVQAGDDDTDGIAVASTVVLNGGTVTDAGENAATLTFSAGATTGVLVDTTAPEITGISGPADATYGTGEDIEFTVTYDEAVFVDTGAGTPAIDLVIGATSRSASYVSGSSTNALVFRYTVQAGDNDSDGVAPAASITPNDGTIADAAGNDADLTDVAPDTTGVLVDTTGPEITGVTGPADGTYVAGEHLDFTVTFDEAVTVDTSSGAPTLPLVIGATARAATYLSGSETSALVFRYTVVADEIDDDGIAPASPIDSNGGTIADATNNAAILTFTPPDTSGVLVDAESPQIISIVRLNPTGQTMRADTVVFEVTFSEAVTGVVADAFALTSFNGGTTTAAVSSVSGGPSVYFVEVSVTGGAGDFRLDALAPGVARSPFAAGLISPIALAFDGVGDLYVANYVDGSISRVTSDATVTTFATGFAYPIALAFDSTGDLYVANALGGAISKVTGDGTVSEFVSGFSVPFGLAFDHDGLLYVSDNSDGTVSTVTSDGTVATFAPGLLAPAGLAFDGAGNLYVASFDTGTVSKVTSDGTVSEFATGFESPLGLVFDSAGDLYVANYGGTTVSRVTSAGTVSTYASGLTTPAGLAHDSTGMLYVSNGDDGTVDKLIGIDGAIADVAGNFLTALPYAAGESYTYDPNDAPTVANAIPNQAATEDSAFNFQFAANAFADADVGDTLTYTAQLAGGGTLPAWLSFDALTRTFSGTPANGDVGTVSLDVIADDGNDGTVTDTFDLVVANANDAPTIANAIPNQNATEDSAFNFQFAANTFADVDVGDTLTYTAQLADGGALPAWLSFDDATRTFSGTPLNADVGTVSLDVIADDGNGGTVTDTFDIVVANSNDAPTIANAIPNQNATGVSAFNFQFAANTFTDVDVGDTLTTTAQLAGGGALPAWLSFDSVTRTFSGTPLNADVGIVSIDVIAGDGNGGTVTDTFDITVVDGVGPIVASVSLPANATYIVGHNLDFTVNFDENVTADTGGGTPYLAITLNTGGTVPAAFLSGSGTSALVFRYTVVAGNEDADGIAIGAAITANGATLRDAADNDATLALNSVGSTAAVLVDGAPPVVNISMSDYALIAGETATVTFTFAEAVSGFDNTDITVPNGILTAVSSADGGVTFTGTYTPDADVEDDTNVLGVDNTAYADAAGNPGFGTTGTINFTIDTSRPTATVTVAESSLAIGDSSLVTITFSEAVSGFTNAGLTVAIGTLDTVTTGDGGITWTATLTPPSAIEDDTNVITLDNTSVTDAAGNAGTGTADSNNYAIDTIAPVNTVPGAQTTTTIESLVFSSGNGNAISVTESSELTTVVSVGSGTLTATTGGGATISNNGTATVNLDGTAAEVNAALDGLTYAPNGAAAQTIAVQSVDAAGNTDDDTIAVTVENATLVVTSNLDTGDDTTTAANLAADQADGSGLSIREALQWASTGDTISFDLDSDTAGNQGGTITLGGTQLTLTRVIAVDGDLDDDGIPDVTISGNNASRVVAVSVNLSGIEMTGLTLTQGNAVGGGGGLALGNNGSLTIRDSDITNNTESGSGGGGIYGSSVTLTVINTTVSNNTSDSFGGGIRAVGNSTLNVINSTVSGNTTTGAGAHGGGIQYAGPILTVVNSTISGNAVQGASADGGGLRITTGTSFVHNSTIVGNAATNNGGGVSANGTSDTFANTVVAGNTAGAGATAAVGGAPLATGGSANDVSGTIESATNGYFGTTATITTNSGSLNNQGTSNLLLGDLDLHDAGLHQTHEPQTGSALIDAGDNAALAADTYDLDGDNDTVELLPRDANGNNRIRGGTVDIGAVEVESEPAIVSVTSTTTDGAYTVGATIAITVEFDLAVTVDTTGGTPTLTLETGTTDRTATYTSGSATTTLVFNYTVQASDNSSDLDYASTSALALNGATMRSDFSIDALLTLPTVGGSDSLGGGKDIVIDTIAPVITSGTSASATYRSAFGGYTISASGSPVSFGAAGLPAGMTVDNGTGAISGTPTVAGAFPVSISATDAAGNSGAESLALTVDPSALTVADVTASNKTYDGTTPATLDTSSAALTGVLGGDTVTLDASSAAGAFADADVGSGKTVTVSGLILAGADAGNYTLTQPTTTANITAAGLTVSGVAASNKSYDGTMTATLDTNSAALVGVHGGDTVTLDASSVVGAFANADVGTGKSVTVSGLSLTGADAGNYTLTQPTATAAITAAGLTVSGVTASNKTYDGTTPATLGTSGAALVGVIGGDTVTLDASGAAGAFVDADAGTAKTVTVSGLAIAGTDAGNYALTQPTATADITAAGLTVSGVTASNKTYDGTTAATLDTGSAALVGVIGGDTVTLDASSAAGAFADADVDTAKTVAVSGLRLAGADAGNYALTQPTATADITTAGLTVSGVTASNKTYDGTTPATLDTSGAALVGVFGADIVTLDVSGAAGVFAGADVGVAKTVTVSGLAISGADAGNYALTQPAVTADITAASATIVIGALAQTYDGSPKAATAITTPADLAVTITYDGAATAPTNAGNYAVVATIDDANYDGTASDSLVIAKADQTISFNPVPGMTFGNVPFDVNATASSGLPVTFSIASGPATISGTTVTITGAGEVLVRASQAGDANRNPAPVVDQSFTIGKANQAITFDALSGVTFGGTPFDVSATADSLLPVAFSIASGPATISGSTLTITGAGTVVVRATQAGDADYNPAPAVDQSFTAGKANQAITFATLNGATFGDAPVALSATANSSLPVTLSVVSGPALISGGQLAFTGAGDAIVRAAQAGDADYNPAPHVDRTIAVAKKVLTVTVADATRAYLAAEPEFSLGYAGFVGADTPSVLDSAPIATAAATNTSAAGIYAITAAGGLDADYAFSYGAGTLTITATSQTITFPAITDRTFGDAAFAPGATASSSLAVNYTVVSGPATVSDGQLSLTGAGEVTIRAAQPGNANYLAAASVDRSFTVSPASATIALSNLDRVFTGSPQSAAATTTPSGLTVNLTYNGSASAPTAAGSYAVVATIAEANYTGSANGTLVIAPATATVTLGNLAATYDGTPKSASATTTPSGLSVNLTYDGSATAPTNAGSYAVVATIADANYSGTASGTLVIAKADQTIAFHPLPGITFGNVPFDVGATATSALPVTFSIASGPASINGNTVTITGAGEVIVRAAQAGDANRNPAPAVDQSFTVGKANQAIAFGAIDGVTFGAAPFAVSATADSLLPVAFSIASGPATISGAIVTITGAGTVVVRASQIGDADYNPAPDVEQSFTTGKANQSITFTALPAASYGDAPVALAASATSNLAVTIAVLSGPATISAGQLVYTGAGDVLVRASQVGDANFNPAPNVDQTITIAQKALTVAAVDASRPYGTANPTFALNYTGFVGADTVADLATAPGATTVATTLSPTGEYVISPSGGLDADYAFTYVSGTLEITPAGQTIDFPVIAEQVYGGAAITLAATATSQLPVNYDVRSGPAIVSGTTVTATGVGEVTVRATQPGNQDFLAAAPVERTFSIAAAPATVTLGSLQHTFDGTQKAVTATTTPAGLAVAITYNGSATAPAHPGSYSVVATITASNYTGTASSTLVIAHATASIALHDLEATFDGSAKSVSAITSPAGLPVTITYDGSANAPVDAGTYAVVATILDETYTGTASGTLTVARAIPTIAWPAPSAITYGTALHALQLNATANVPGSFVYSPGAGAVLPAGANQPLGVTFTPDDSTNFATIEGSTTITVTKAAATITLGGLVQDFNGAPRPVSVMTSPAGLEVAVTYDGASTAPTYPGQYDVAASVVSDNHAATAVGTLVIQAPALQIFFGAIGVQGTAGDLAATVARDFSGGTIVGYLPDTGEGFVVVFILQSDGSFTSATVTFTGSLAPAAYLPANVAAATAGGRTLTFSGQLVNGVLSGVIEELGLAFSALVDPVTGPTAGVAGFYQGAATETADGQVYTVVGTNGQVYVLALANNQVVAGPGVVAADGGFDVTADTGASIAGVVDPAAETVLGLITLPDQTQQSFLGTDVGTPRTDRLVNYSSRGRVGSGDNVLIAGFVVNGSGPQRLLLRAVGPGLQRYGLADVVADPQLQVYNGNGQLVLANDDWDSAVVGPVADAAEAFTLTAGSTDAAVVATLPPGAYTMHVSDLSGQGVALAEIYDASEGGEALQRLVNVSTRGRVEAGERVLIGGFVVSGNAPKRVLVRGIGPSLAAHGVAGVLADPVLRLFNEDGELLGGNDNWETPQALLPGQTAALAETITATGATAQAFPLSAGSMDSALIITLAPGAYTAQVSGASGAGGVALIEVYEVPLE